MRGRAVPERIGGDGAPEDGVSGTASARFFVPGRPKPLPRARSFWDAKRGTIGTRNKAGVATYQATIGWYAKAKGCRRLIGPVELRLWIFVKGRRGDIDNYLKQFLDALTGVAYVDDRQVVEVRAQFAEMHSASHEGVDVEILER